MQFRWLTKRKYLLNDFSATFCHENKNHCKLRSGSILFAKNNLKTEIKFKNDGRNHEIPTWDTNF